MKGMSASRLTIEPLGEHPELIELTCGWHVPEFDPDGDVDFWLSARRKEATLEGVPCAWIAFDDGVPVGSVSLIEHNMDTRRDLMPWLAALFVLPNHRRRGIGAALVERCEQEAVRAGRDRLFLFTTMAADYYRRFGWDVMTEEFYEDETVIVMSKDLPRVGSPTVRTSVRVILIDDDERVLMMSAHDPSSDLTVWFMPGGTMEPGESMLDTAHRELAEEVEGLPAQELEGPVWTRHHRHTWDGRAVDVTEWYFVSRIGPAELVRSVRETGPGGVYFADWRWWTVDELETFDGEIAPRRIAELLPAILRGELPDEPIATGI